MKKYFFAILLALFFGQRAMPIVGFPDDSVFHMRGIWLDTDNKEFLLSQLAGQTLVLAMVYTSCQYSCPLIIEEINKIKDKIPKTTQDKVKFVLVSMDPERDTPQTLKNFAKKRHLDSRWVLLTAKSDGPVRELSIMLGANYKQVGNDFAHSNLVTILNSHGVIVFSKPNLRQQIEEAARVVVTSIERMVKS